MVTAGHTRRNVLLREYTQLPVPDEMFYASEPSVNVDQNALELATPKNGRTPYLSDDHAWRQAGEVYLGM